MSGADWSGNATFQCQGATGEAKGQLVLECFTHITPLDLKDNHQDRWMWKIIIPHLQVVLTEICWISWYQLVIVSGVWPSMMQARQYWSTLLRLLRTASPFYEEPIQFSRYVKKYPIILSLKPLYLHKYLCYIQYLEFWYLWNIHLNLRTYVPGVQNISEITRQDYPCAAGSKWRLWQFCTNATHTAAFCSCTLNPKRREPQVALYIL